MRKLASIQTIVEIQPIPNADSIEKARVNNWWVVVKKGEFVAGDKCIYAEIDSWIPTQLAPFLTKEGKEPNVYKGVQGELLRTIRLRKQLSQGLILPMSVLPSSQYNVGDDVTKVLGIIKWEPVIPDEMEGARGWPSFIPKTDEERVQNIPTVLDDHGLHQFEATIKIDGQSSTFFYGGSPRFGCCTRNYEIKKPTWWRNLFARIKRWARFKKFKKKATVWDIAKKYNLEKVLPLLDRQYAFQGEIFGEGIQGNPEKITGQAWVVFNIYDIQDGRYLSPTEREELIEKINHVLMLEILKGKSFTPIKMVPVLDTFVLGEKFKTVQDILDYAEGPSLNANVKREGVVFKRSDGQFSFKAIANSYLLGK